MLLLQMTIISISLIFLLVCDYVKLHEIPGCRSSFPCRGLGILGPPFFNGMLNDCGLIEVDCYDGKIKLGKESQWYHVRNLRAHDRYYSNNIYGPNVFELRDNLLEEKLKARSCESFKNITIPTSPGISYRIYNKNANFVRCTGNSSQVTAQYFSGYYNYTGCPGYSLYYMYPNDDDDGLFATIPPTCSVIQVPVAELDEPERRYYHYTSSDDRQHYHYTSDPFQIITANISVKWDVLYECTQCYYNGGMCSTNNTHKQEFQCIGGNPDTIPRRIPWPERGTHNRLRTILIIVTSGTFGAATIVIAVFIVFRKKIAMIWRKKTDLYRNIQAFGKNLNFFALRYSDIKKIVIRWSKKTKRFRYSGIKKTIRKWRMKTKSHRTVKTFLKNYGSLTPKRYKYSDIKKMTNSFRDKLGEGGYGFVYKGKLNNGNLVAVKVLKESKGDGEEFFNEVASISRTSHVNVVTLLGFCLTGRKRALIYEFMPNGSLEKFVYDKISSTNRQLGWDKYYKIAVGIARGLEYLHRGCNTRILHFDIKPHNILLDEDFVPKISDFGLAKLCPGKESAVSMMNPRGTIGYIAPEIFSKEFGRVSHKSDVYSYGMMVLEMVGWKKNIEVQVSGDTSEMYFPDWIYKRLEADKEVGMYEIKNEDEDVYERKMIIVSLWCIQSDPSNRPSMSRVVDMLEGSSESLQIPPRPVLSSPSLSPLSHYSSTIDIS